MFKIGLISDTHGNRNKIDLILDYTKDLGIDIWIHSGDYVDDARYMKEKLNIPVVMVRGNCDYNEREANDEEIFSFAGIDIYVAHGHELNPYELEREFRWIAKTYSVSLIVTGHTHIYNASFIDENTLNVNPGSVSRPRDGSNGTFAIVTGEKNKPETLNIEFIDMSELAFE